jgi:hypothetical protein
LSRDSRGGWLRHPGDYFLATRFGQAAPQEAAFGVIVTDGQGVFVLRGSFREATQPPE